MKMKRWLAALLVCAMIIPMVVAAPPIEARAATSVEITVSSLVSYTPQETILNRINEIRKEACNEGITFDGRTLKPSDYVPLTWSTDMEEIAMTRAVEASISFSHTRPDGSRWYTAESSEGLTSNSEIIASMGNALGDIQLWYSEKEDLLNGDEDAAGHYIALINPRYKSFGMASSGVSVGEFSLQSFEGTGRDKLIYDRNAYLNVDIVVDPDNVDLRILGGNKVSTTGKNALLLGIVIYDWSSWGYDVLPLQDVTWKSSNPAIISIDENGEITGHKVGTVTITASQGDVSFTKEVKAVVGQWKKNAKGWWYDLEDGYYPAQQFMEINGKEYFFDSKGYMATGWEKIYGDWYYFGSNGAMRTGWLNLNGKWYYLDPDEGYMSEGWDKVDDKWYYFGDNGVMRYGWQKVNNKWYYLGTNGAMRTGWQKVNNKWYYMDDGGVMQTGWKKVDGIWYYLGDNGVMCYGWQKVNNKWYYLGTNGKMVAGQWVGNYYLLDNGVMATNQWIGKYYVGADGKWVKDKTK